MQHLTSKTGPGLYNFKRKLYSGSNGKSTAYMIASLYLGVTYCNSSIAYIVCYKSKGTFELNFGVNKIIHKLAVH